MGVCHIHRDAQSRAAMGRLYLSVTEDEVQEGSSPQKQSG